jgi:acyl-CoA thioesterase FadM
MLYTFDIVATADLFVKYLMPVRKGELYLLTGEIEKREGRKIHVKATIQDLETKKKVAEGYTMMMTVKW